MCAGQPMGGLLRDADTLAEAAGVTFLSVATSVLHWWLKGLLEGYYKGCKVFYEGVVEGLPGCYRATL